MSPLTPRRATDGPRELPRVVSLIVALAVAIVACAVAALAQTPAPKPKLPPGVDPGGVAIGIITTGIDYRLGIAARCLARDGEGELIGWDLVDRDRLPFAARAVGVMDDSVLASAVNCDGRMRLVPVRIDTADAATIARAIAFLASTPARIVVLPATHLPSDWAALQAAAERFGQVLIVIAATGDAVPEAVAKLPSVAQVSATVGGGDAAASMLALGHAVFFVACAADVANSSMTGAALKVAFVAHMIRAGDKTLGELMSPKCS